MNRTSIFWLVDNIIEKYAMKGKSPLLKEVAKNVQLDFQQPIGYLIPAILITFAGVMIYLLLYRMRTRTILLKRQKKKMSVVVLLIIYIEVLLQTAFFSREPGSRTGIDITMFSTWGETAKEHAYFIENIMMFVPLGILLPMLFKKMRKLQYCVLSGFLCSCMIEVSQLITQRGFCQLDDVITNTVGAAVGWMIWRIYKYLTLSGK